MGNRETRDESENGVDQPPTVIHNHYSQSKNGNGNGPNINSVLLACIIGILGFLGLQIWNMNERLTRVETNVQIVVGQPERQL